jgi:hypothetical protein
MLFSSEKSPINGSSGIADLLCTYGKERSAATEIWLTAALSVVMQSHFVFFLPLASTQEIWFKKWTIFSHSRKI